MTSDELIVLVITGVLGAVVIALAVMFLVGRGTAFIAGYNTMTSEEKEKFDHHALCRFMGKVLLPVGIMTPATGVGAVLRLNWVFPVYTVAVVVLILFAVIWCNTGNRYLK